MCRRAPTRATSPSRPCKQQPNPANLNGNQKWVLPSSSTPGPIEVDIAGNGNYTGGTTCAGFSTSCFCVSSPNSTAAGVYVDVAPCDGSNAQKWSVPGRVALSTSTWAQNWAASYVIKDYWGRCLAPAGPGEPYHTLGYHVSRMVVAACDGGDAQKWNAMLVQTHGVSGFAEQ